MYLHHFFNFNLKLLNTTLTLEQAIRALANIGVILKSLPNICITPPANGMQTTLYINAQNRFSCIILTV